VKGSPTNDVARALADTPSWSTARRRLLIGSLGEKGDPASEKLLLELASGGSKAERLAAAEALLSYRSEATARFFLEEASTDPDYRVRALAATALGELGTPDAVELLRRLTHDARSIVRRRAIQAMARSGGEAATLTLGAIIRDGEERSAGIAARELGKVGSTEAWQVMTTASAKHQKRFQQAYDATYSRNKGLRAAVERQLYRWDS